ncbi:hypothetical protein I6F34_01365 [Bradyrhizobium sp. BRP05]|nr:hypothetical protein [Bradyrhizobium sp. BRP05]
MSILRNNRTLGARELMELLPGRSEKAINAQRERYNLRKSWLAHEVDVLRDNQHLTATELMPLLPGRPRKLIQSFRVKVNYPYVRPTPKPKPKRSRVIAKPSTKRRLIPAAGCDLNF